MIVCNIIVFRKSLQSIWWADVVEYIDFLSILLEYLRLRQELPQERYCGNKPQQSFTCSSLDY